VSYDVANLPVMKVNFLFRILERKLALMKCARFTEMWAKQWPWTTEQTNQRHQNYRIPLQPWQMCLGLTWWGEGR